MFIAPSSQYKTYETDALWLLNPQRDKTFTEPVNVKMLFFMPTKRRVDLVNLEESCLDILVKAGILEDDNSNIVASMDGSKVLYDKSNPRTEIYIDYA